MPQHRVILVSEDKIFRLRCQINNFESMPFNEFAKEASLRHVELCRVTQQHVPSSFTVPFSYSVGIAPLPSSSNMPSRKPAASTAGPSTHSQKRPPTPEQSGTIESRGVSTGSGDRQISPFKRTLLKAAAVMTGFFTNVFQPSGKRSPDVPLAARWGEREKPPELDEGERAKKKRRISVIDLDHSDEDEECIAL
mmetsp:Transcript_19828/g.33019  ORF Transcript_19828/g.33019 Transcript_19828/m.33019 type:complete len:194 (+) Transcript_19828:18-599(+)